MVSCCSNIYLLIMPSLNRMDPLPSLRLLQGATKRWLKYYCLLERMFISKLIMFVFMIFDDKKSFFLYFRGFYFDFNLWVCLSNRKDSLPSSWHPTKRWRKFYCLLEQMLITKAMFVELMIVMMNIVLSLCILRGRFCSDFYLLFDFVFL